VKLAVQGVSKTFRVRGLRRRDDTLLNVLRRLSFDVYEGEVVSLIGESGCGKTTLLRIVQGHWKSRTAVGAKCVRAALHGSYSTNRCALPRGSIRDDQFEIGVRHPSCMGPQHIQKLQMNPGRAPISPSDNPVRTLEVR